MTIIEWFNFFLSLGVSVRAWRTIILVTFSLFSLTCVLLAWWEISSFLRFFPPKRKKPHIYTYRTHAHIYVLFLNAIIRIHIGLMTISLFPIVPFRIFSFFLQKKWRKEEKMKPFAITGKGEPRNNIQTQYFWHSKKPGRPLLYLYNGLYIPRFNERTNEQAATIEPGRLCAHQLQTHTHTHTHTSSGKRSAAECK